MQLNRFLEQRRLRWQRLSDLLDRIDSRGWHGLSSQEVDEMFSLYRLVSSDLNLAQTRTANPAVLEYLEGLVARAYAMLAVPRKARPFKAWWRIMRHRFPAIIRRERWLFALAAAVTVVGIVFGYVTTYLVPSTDTVFLDASHLSETPAHRVHRLEQMERDGNTRVDSGGTYAVFSSFLFTHNIRVIVFCFALGLTFGIGTTMMLFYNGAMLGSLACLYWKDGVMMFFLGWVGPHGSIEIPCVLFGGMAGYMLARAQLNVKQGTVWEQITDMRPVLVDLLIGASSLLVVAGCIEGGFSQINAPTLPYPLKIAVACVLFCLLMVYLFWIPIDDQALSDHAVDEAAEREWAVGAAR